MNPFERLRHTIEKVNITYEFPEEQEPEVQVRTAGVEGYPAQGQRTMTVNSTNNVEEI